MNAPLAYLLVRLYPRSWRERYGEEFEALLQTRAGVFGTTANVLWFALYEHVSPTPGLNVDRGSGSNPFASWSARAPWAIFGLAPLLFLAGSYLIACLILWSGWRMFLPESNSPFVRIDGFAVFYFNAGRFVFYSAPILIGWATALLAARQKFKPTWPSVGLILIAWIGGAAQVHTSRTPAQGELGRVSLVFALGSSVHGIPAAVSHAVLILSLTLLPYLIRRVERIHPRSG